MKKKPSLPFCYSCNCQVTMTLYLESMNMSAFPEPDHRPGRETEKRVSITEPWGCETVKRSGRSSWKGNGDVRKVRTWLFPCSLTLPALISRSNGQNKREDIAAWDCLMKLRLCFKHTMVKPTIL